MHNNHDNTTSGSVYLDLDLIHGNVSTNVVQKLYSNTVYL